MVHRTHELDLTDRIEKIDERLHEIEQEKEQVKTRAERKARENDLEQPPDEEREQWEELEAERVEKEGEKRKFIQTVVDYTQDIDASELDEDEILEEFADVDSCVWVVKELSFGQLQRVSDDMMEESFDVDVRSEDIEGTPRQGFYQIELLVEAIDESPPHAPTFQDEYNRSRPEPSEYPIAVGEWLFDKVDALNTTGDTDMGNSSLKEAMKFEK